MKVRTFLIMLASLGLAFAATLLIVNNGAILHQPIQLWGGRSISVSVALLLMFVLGGMIVLLLGGTREVARGLKHWRGRKATKKSHEIEDEYSRGWVAVLQGRSDEALRHFRAVLERDSRHFDTLLNLGEILRGQEKYTEAIEFHRKAQNLKKENTRPLYALVDDYEAQGDLDQARVTVGKIIAINKSSIAAWRQLRSLHIKDHRWGEALEAHERVQKLAAPDNPGDVADRRVALGIRYETAVARSKDKPKAAIAAFRALLKEADHFIPAYVKLGETLINKGQEAEAIQVWHGGFNATGSPTFLTILEEHYLQQEQPLAAIEALKRCVTDARNDALPRFYLGKLYFRLEMLDDAHSVLSALEGRASYAPIRQYLLGRIHERRANYVEAAREYRSVIEEKNLVQLEYCCHACHSSTMQWDDRCDTCGEWNSVEVTFGEETTPDELGPAAAPIY